MNIPSWMKAWWWKILGVIIFLYVLIGGLTTPLNPGITQLTPDHIQAGQEVDLIITGYNTNYHQAENHAWLKLDDEHIL